MDIRYSPRHIAKALSFRLHRHTHHRQALRFYSQFIRKGDLVFDIGAHEGSRTELFIELGAKVIAVEPQWALANALRRFKCELVQSAVGAEPGEAEMSFNTFSALASLSPEFISATKDSPRFAEHHYTHTATVPVTTLDQLIQQYGVPSFCKIDVEGFEHDVLKRLSQPITLSFEANSECLSTSLDCLARLRELNYSQFNYSPDESMTMMFRDWVDLPTVKATLLDRKLGDWGDVYARA